ncbi:MAG: tyrosine-type recombinase/integrase [Gammaproteobacteria bacterium]|nr:tyrosine-type recombinase/integrase [Gammaproteobacteria bacterium]
MAKRLTDRQVRNLKPKAQRYEIWEEGSAFGIRVFPSGIKSWVLMYRYQGRQRRMTLGRYPKMTVAEAHQAHANALLTLELGEDPGEALIDARKLDRTSPTVGSLVTLYLEGWAKRRKRSWTEDERILNKDVLPQWRNRKARKIARRDVIELLDGIVDRGAPITANRTLEVVRRMFNYAIERGLLEVNPCAGIRPPGKERRRERVLSEEEIKVFWNKLSSANMSEMLRLALRILLVTAQRRGEIVSARWQDIDRKNGWWTIPPTKSKNGLSHRVPLSKLASVLLDQLESITGDSDYLFPSPTRDGHIAERSVSRTVLRNQKHFGLERFTPHDLRRTAASRMASLGIPRDVLGKILNHMDRSVTAVYDRHTYDPEKRRALDTWGRKLQNVVCPRQGTVIELQSIRETQRATES